MKSAHQIASDIVDAMPLKLGVTSAQKAVLTVMVAATITEQLSNLRGEVKHLKDILRTDPTQLEIRMSMGDYHVRRAISKTEIDRSGLVMDLIAEHAKYMFHMLSDWIKQKDKK